MTKYCLVPRCTVNSKNNPDKRFLTLPKDEKKRKLWLQASRRDVKSISITSIPYICEDHFNLEEDAENWIRLKYYPGSKITLKPGVIPHVFECQPERRAAQPPKERLTSAGRARRQLLRTLISSESTPASTSTSVSEREENTSHTQNPGEEIVENLFLFSEYFSNLAVPEVPKSTSNEESRTCYLHPDEVLQSPGRSVTPRKRRFGFSPSRHRLSPQKRHSDNTGCTGTPPSKRYLQPFGVTSTSPSRAEHSPIKSTISATPRTWRAAETLCQLQEERREKGTQTVIVQSACKSVLCKPLVRSESSQTVVCALVNKQSAEYESVASSPFKLPTELTASKISNVTREGSSDSFDEISSITSNESSSTELLNTTGSSFSEEQEDIRISDVEGATALQKLNVQLCLRDPMYFLGIPETHIKLVDVLADAIQADIVGVMITLRKIRLNPPFKELAYNFSVSDSFCSKTFHNLVPKLSDCFSKLILWPSKDDIKRHLPVTFRARYSNVQSIIDCFEIEIDKPSDPIMQTLTWSQYKKCNTMKYLISCTPDGCINYISKGYAGGTSDVKLTEDCGYLYVLPDEAAVMANGGFKAVAPLLSQKNCELVHPPSVSADQEKNKTSKLEVTLGRRIAGLRIYIGRVIRRLREFSILKPHSCVRHELVKYLDHIAVIACGLVNLQKPLIKRYV